MKPKLMQTNVHTVKSMSDAMGVRFDRWMQNMIGHHAAWLLVTDRKVAPEKLKGRRVNVYYDDEKEYLIMAISEAMRIVKQMEARAEDDKRRSEMIALLEKFGTKPYPRLIHRQIS